MHTLKDIVTLSALQARHRERFIRENQRAFYYGAMEEFVGRDDRFKTDEEIISRETIEECLDADGAEAYEIMVGDAMVGGLVLHTETDDKGVLDLLFIVPHAHSCGIGQSAWREVERLHPEIRVWETVTPYFEKRNVHFYVNRCGFHIVVFFNSHHADPHGGDGDMFRFEKVVARK